jgi:bacterioferritin-associated ferredoxin
MVRIIVYIVSMFVCICNRITESEVRKAARCGAKTADAAYACQGCEVQCGCCLDYAQEVIDEERGVPRHLRLVSAKAA